MKKIYAISGLVALCLAGMSCVQELNEDQNTIPSSGTLVSLSVSDEEWVSTKSTFTANDGIRLTKEEKIGLLYDNGSLLVGNNSYAIVASSPLKNGDYSFTAPSGSLNKTWYGIVPYSYAMTRARISTERKLMLTFPAIQFPGKNTFDPQTDFLVAKPFTIGTEGANTAKIDAFKRITAPFKLQITGLDPGEKIYAVTFALSVVASSPGNMLAGVCYYNFGPEPGDFTNAGLQMSYTRSNDLSAIYDEGLEDIDGVWPVWFNVLPSKIIKNSTVTLTVFTANACYTRAEIPINAGTFQTNKINTFTVNIKGSGYTMVPAISQGFFRNGLPDATQIASAATEQTLSLTATDGVERNWDVKAYNWTAAKLDGGSTLPDAIGFPDNQNAYIMIPAVNGKTITKVRLYLAPISYAESSRDLPLDVCNGETTLASYSSISMVDESKGYTRGGFVDIPCPSGVSNMAGLTLKVGYCNNKRVHMLVSRIVLFTN